jgi:hypothetical protein
LVHDDEEVGPGVGQHAFGSADDAELVAFEHVDE